MFSKLMKRLTAVLLVCALLLPAALAASYPFQGVLTGAAVLRRGTGDGAEALASLPAGDAVYITGESGSYYIAEYDGVTGYLPKAVVSADSINAPTAEAADRYAALRLGDSGQAVTDLQSALTELQYLSGKADGKYGAKTAQAVKDFQVTNGLAASGAADAATQSLLFEGEPLNAKGKKASVTTVPTVEGFPLTKGKKGELVTRVQSSLTVLGYYSGKVDGVYGASTVTAVKKFQQKNGLTATGTADAAVQSLLFGGSPLSASATATPKPTATPVPDVIGWTEGKPAAQEAEYPFETVTLDSVNLRKKASVTSARLATLPKGASVTVSALQGDFALITYQTKKKTYTGYVMSQYVDIPAIYLGGRELPEDADAQKKYVGLSAGASGDAVTALQNALRELGFYTAVSTGYYDDATTLAVKAMQRKNDILQTGNASAELQKLIFEGKPLNMKGAKTDVKELPPYDGVSMRQGDTGYQVAELQEALTTLGFYEGVLSGVYDAATAAAVKAFQKKNNLTADGVVGSKVYAALDVILVPTPEPVIAAVPVTTPSAITADTLVVLRRGTRGLAVTRAQERLVELGYYAITPDGIYDNDDIQAVRDFQKKNGLTVDGVAGLQTQQLLYSAAALSASATPTPAPATPAPTMVPSTSTTLRLGSTGSEVNLLQARLTMLKYFNDTIDGSYGTATAAAVAAFQSANGLTADGVAGPQTLRAVYASSAKEAPAEVQPTAAPVLSASGVLKIGDTGNAVKTLQRILIELGYLSGAADGIFGTKTYLALESFQRANNLTVDGVAGSATLDRLESAAAKKKINAQTAAVPDATPVPAVTGTAFKSPTAAEVRFADWYNEIRTQAKLMPDAIIYDYKTGLHYNVHMFSFGKHCDAEPITASDTAIMYQIMGMENWDPHAVWVILSDGKVYMASTHSHGHQVDIIAGNNLEGHICIHFPRTLSDEEKETMPYALSHQQEILRGWEETQAMIK